jgi:tRNA(Glu) U13 pseudouridine synthase TruD
MGFFNVINKDNQVINVIVAETIEDAETVTEERCMEVDEANTSLIGKYFVDGEYLDEYTPEIESQEATITHEIVGDKVIITNKTTNTVTEVDLTTLAGE